jgi:hypothetical protein
VPAKTLYPAPCIETDALELGYPYTDEFPGVNPLDDAVGIPLTSPQNIGTMTIYKGRQVPATATATATETATATAESGPVNSYITRMNQIMSQLLTTKKKEVAIARLDILKQEIALMKEKK